MSAIDSGIDAQLSAMTFTLPKAASRRGRKTTSVKDRITLDKLKQMRFAELDRLYRQLSPPDTLNVLNGRKKGALLAIAGLHRTPAGLLINAFGKTPFFPWVGKSFSARSLIKGSGINRINLTLTRQEWFAFQSGFRSSIVDGRPCISLNYRLKSNHWLVRQLTDELREIEPGLYLGVTFLHTSKLKLKLLYFVIGK